MPSNTSSQVWEIIHHVIRTGGDVAVASNKTDDPDEWRRAHYGALQNMRNSQAQAERWATIADEMQEGLAKAQQAETQVYIERYEGGS